MLLKDLMKLYEEGTEITLTDIDIDCEFYIYNNENENENEDECDLFIDKLVKLLKVKKILSHGTVVVDLYGLINKNIELFRDYSDKHWSETVNNSLKDDNSEFCEEWVLEIVNFINGYASEKTYKEFTNSVLNKIK